MIFKYILVVYRSFLLCVCVCLCVLFHLKQYILFSESFQLWCSSKYQHLILWIICTISYIRNLYLVINSNFFSNVFFNISPDFQYHIKIYTSFWNNLLKNCEICVNIYFQLSIVFYSCFMYSIALASYVKRITFYWIIFCLHKTYARHIGVGQFLLSVFS